MDKGHTTRSRSVSDKFDDFYVMGPELGRGQFGVVRICVDRRTGTKWACKVLSKHRLNNPDHLDEINREIAILARVRGHKNIVDLKAVFEDSSNIYLVMDCCSGGELFDLVNQLGNFPEDDAADIFRQLVDAVAYCHSKDVMHRDIKPENILLVKNPKSPELENERLLCELTGRKFQKYQIKLADFGLALFLRKGQRVEGIAGSPLYLAPEVVSSAYNKSADIWSLGVILYILLCGSAPFCGDSDLETLQQIEEGFLDFSGPVWASVSPSAVDLVCKLLKHNPEERLSLDEILLHPWMIAQSLNAMTDVEKERLLMSLQQQQAVHLPRSCEPSHKVNPMLAPVPPFKSDPYAQHLYSNHFSFLPGNQALDPSKLSMWI